MALSASRTRHVRSVESLTALDVTPLLPIEIPGSAATIWCKAEYLHPSGSTKDRIACHILSKAVREGRLRAGAEVVEASSGSTSIAMSMVCARLGLRFRAFMPEGVSRERSVMIRAYGGEVELTSRAEGIVGALEASRAWASRNGSFEPRQFENPDNAEAHRTGTAAEILRQIPQGRVDAYVSGVGTGGTLVGMRLGFADAGLAPHAFAARPIAGSSGVSCDCFAAAEQCSFSGRIPGVLDGMSHLYKPAEFARLDVVEVSDEEAMRLTRALIGMGHPVGPSSGLNLAAAIEASRRLPAGAVIVTVLCDRMERYFSTELFASWDAASR
jgi:cysteine synthase A